MRRFSSETKNSSASKSCFTEINRVEMFSSHAVSTSRHRASDVVESVDDILKPELG